MENIRDYIFNIKWIFPKIILTKYPGIILNKVVKRYGKITSISRGSYIFEDTLVDLQLDSIKKIGKNKTSEIWYMIGKDSIISYFLVSKAKKPPEIFLKKVIEYIFNRFTISGMSFGFNIIFNNKEKSLILKGRDNVVCRKSGEGEIFAGIASAVMSFLTGENIEAKVISCCHNPKEEFCKIIANRDIETRYIINYNQFKKLIKNYDLVIPKKNQEYIFNKYKQFTSLNDFMEFEKIKIIDNKTYFKDETIIFGEINTADHIITNYMKNNLMFLLEKSLINSGKKKIAKILDTKKLTRNDKLKFIQNMMAAFGWGIPLYEIKKDKIIFNFIFGAQAITNSFLFYALQLNGFLNYIFNEKFEIKEIKMILSKFPINKVIYKLSKNSEH